MNFLSDNTATANPELLEAIRMANSGSEQPYGEDRWSRRLDRVFSEFFGTEVRVYPVVTGTAANALALATLSPPYGAIYAHEEAHVIRDECGAPEFFSGGARVVAVSGDHGKITPEVLMQALSSNPPTVHTLQPAALTLTQATESGTVYRPEDIGALSAIAHQQHLGVHLDGARFANALVTLGCAAADITWRAGIDVMSFGATKNGALGAEAVVYFDLKRVGDFELRRKRAGHLLSKTRYVAAQLIAYIESEVWRRNALHSNRLAQRIAAARSTALLHPVQANEVFMHFSEEELRKLRAGGFEFYDWGATGSGNARFVISWDQPEEDVNRLCEALAKL